MSYQLSLFYYLFCEHSMGYFKTLCNAYCWDYTICYEVSSVMQKNMLFSVAELLIGPQLDNYNRRYHGVIHIAFFIFSVTKLNIASLPNWHWLALKSFDLRNINFEKYWLLKFHCTEISCQNYLTWNISLWKNILRKESQKKKIILQAIWYRLQPEAALT